MRNSVPASELVNETYAVPGDGNDCRGFDCEEAAARTNGANVATSPSPGPSTGGGALTL